MMDIAQVKRTGEDPGAEVKKLLDKYDQNKDGKILWNELVDMMVTLRGSGVNFIPETQNTKHTVSDTEVVAFSSTLNQIMSENERWKDHPIDTKDKQSLFMQFKNGEYICDLLHTIDKESGILLKAINRGQTSTF